MHTGSSISDKRAFQNIRCLMRKIENGQNLQHERKPAYG